MSAKKMVEVGLIVSGAAAGAVGAALIEPVVIGLGVAAAGAAAVMRMADNASRR